MLDERRAFDYITEAITDASSVVQNNFNQSKWKSTRHGFIASRFASALVADAVTGTAGATEAIGTVLDWNGTELETEVTEPLAADLTYEEEVEVTPCVAAVQATYDEEGNELTPYVEEVEATYETVTRTKTWTATGERPVYQGVDQTKIDPVNGQGPARDAPTDRGSQS